MSKTTTFVTQPSLPPLEEFIPYLEQIWENKVLTNCGPFHQQLEEALCRYLGVEHIALFTNGTIALVTALQSLRVSGEVITTPYSFVATFAFFALERHQARIRRYRAKHVKY
jgi:dTDP-4-amino-4,6-dideoxygalactose transaminase